MPGAYILRAGDTEMVKLGWATDPQSRLRALQTAHWLPLSIIRVIEGPEPIERWMHRRFREHHVGWEWFRFQPEMLTIEPPTLLPQAGIPAVDDIFDLFGGRDGIVSVTGAAKNAVNNWRHSGIPYKYQHVLIRAAEGRGIAGVTGDTLHAARPTKVAA
jgi:hypothetical protein